MADQLGFELKRGWVQKLKRIAKRLSPEKTIHRNHLCHK